MSDHASTGPSTGTETLSGHPLFARLARIGQRVRQADRDHPWVLDAAVVAAVFLVFCLPDLFPWRGGDGPREHRITLVRLALPQTLACSYTHL